MDLLAKRRVLRVFEAAIELPPEKQSAYLDRACGNDRQVRREVEMLLSIDPGDCDFLEGPAIDLIEEEPPWRVRRPGDRLGPYRIIRELGQGGMGVVFLARREDRPAEELAALKALKPGLNHEIFVQRFQMERELLALLRHPHIVSSFGGGVADDGLPYMAMEYVDGESLLAYCEKRRLEIDRRVVFIIKLCGAIAHAHERGVIHRDLKPCNIMVNRWGRLKLLDFGIAKSTSPDIVETPSGLRPLTPDYASPEQLAGEPASTGDDTYALGLVFYKLLTGHHPFRLLRRLGLGKEAPLTPSQAIARDREACPGAAVRRPTPAKLEDVLVRGLDDIALQAIHRDPASRFRTPAQFAQSLRLWLREQRSQALRPRLTRRPPGLTRRLSLTALLPEPGRAG